MNRPSSPPLPAVAVGPSATGANALLPVAKRPKWVGVVEVCNTCDRQARWPFCAHRVSGSQWYRLVTVRETGRTR